MGAYSGKFIELTEKYIISKIVDVFDLFLG